MAPCPAGGELEVQAAFHETVHASKVAALSFSPDGAALWTGCDAAAPKPVPDDGEAPVATVDCSTGAVQHRAAGMPVCNVRLLLPLPAAGGVLCVTGDGGLFMLSADTAAMLSSGALPGTPAAAAAAADDDEGGLQQQPAGQSQPASPQPSEAASDSGDSGSASVAAGPEFTAEAGYRGHREGYLFRTGALGRGYYRKDVVRRYCRAAAAEPPTPPAAAAEPAAAAAASSEDSAEPAGGAGQHSLQSGEAARAYIQRLLAAPPSMHSVVADAAGGLLLTSSLGLSDRSIRVWRLTYSGASGASGASVAVRAELHRTLTGHSAPVLSLALSPDGRLLYSGSHDQTVRVWSTAEWHCLRVLKGHGGGVRALAAAADGATLYTAAADNTIRAWSTQHWVCLRTMHGRHEDTTWPACLALSPCGALLASGSTGPFGASTIKVFQTGGGSGRDAGACVASFAQLGYHAKGGISALLFSADGATLYSGASDGTLAGWRLSWREAAGGAAAARGLRRGFL